MQLQIEEKLNEALDIHFLEVVNETHMHNVPADAESHFKITVVSDDFKDQALIMRHRLINQYLARELVRIHALALHTMTIDEYAQKSQQSPDSPQCMGGSAAK